MGRREGGERGETLNEITDSQVIRIKKNNNKFPWNDCKILLRIHHFQSSPSSFSPGGGAKKTEIIAGLTDACFTIGWQLKSGRTVTRERSRLIGARVFASSIVHLTFVDICIKKNYYYYYFSRTFSFFLLFLYPIFHLFPFEFVFITHTFDANLWEGKFCQIKKIIFFFFAINNL